MSVAGLHIVLVSVHGLIRGNNPEYGRDADTGGQVRYVIELARALADRRRVARVDILTRRIVDSTVSSVYSKATEQIAENAFIVRLSCGTDDYIRKEALWSYLSLFADSAREYIASAARGPLLFHSHYADSGMVAVELAKQLHAPHVFTGHSLGRAKRQRLLEAGVSQVDVEQRFNMSTRIASEEWVMSQADLVIASTDREIRKQYSLYGGFDAWRSIVNPPGIDTHTFRPPDNAEKFTEVRAQLDALFSDPEKPLILAISRPDERKNLTVLAHSFIGVSKLRERANLLIVSGGSGKYDRCNMQPNQALSELRSLIYSHNLEGSVALLEFMPSDRIAELYKIAFRSRGALVNSALTEPFGLTLLEASATGLPIIATRDGGPSEIIQHCRNGLLIDPLDTGQIAEALLCVLNNMTLWETCSNNGLRLIRKNYSWSGHTDAYLNRVESLFRPDIEKESSLRPYVCAIGA